LAIGVRIVILLLLNLAGLLEAPLAELDLAS
jgi:hypothetical protein